MTSVSPFEVICHHRRNKESVMIIESTLTNPFIFWTIWIVGCIIAICLPVFLIYWGARHGKPQYRWPFTEVPLGKGMIIKCGSLPIMIITGGSSTYKNFRLVDINGNPMTKDSLDASTGRIKDQDSFVNKNNVGKSGLYFIGWIPFVNRIHVFHFAWDELAKEESTGPGFEIKARTIDSPFFSPAKTFAFWVKEVEMGGYHAKKQIDDTKSGDPTPDDPDTIAQRLVISLVLSGRVVIVDATKALIISNWYKQVHSIITQACTKYCGRITIDRLIENAGTELVEEIMLKNFELLERYGIVFFDLNYNGYQYAGDNVKEIEEASTERFQAQQRGQGALAEAQGKAQALLEMATAQATQVEKMAVAEANAIQLKGKANADALKLLREAAGDDPAVLQALAIRDTKVTTLALGTNTATMLNPKG